MKREFIRVIALLSVLVMAASSTMADEEMPCETEQTKLKQVLDYLTPTWDSALNYGVGAAATAAVLAHTYWPVAQAVQEAVSVADCKTAKPRVGVREMRALR
jgi:hypothetical protein